jgi:hypothetical protein
MESQYPSILANCTWTLMPLPIGQKTIIPKWIYCCKPSLKGVGIMDKARLLAKGFQQKAGINHSNTFAHVVKWKTIWLFSALATHLQ